MTPVEIVNEAVSKLNKKITNEIFIIIQNDRKLMYEYLRAIETHGLDTLNRSIGKEIKSAYSLNNIDEREDDPSCTLIQSHQKFE